MPQTSDLLDLRGVGQRATSYRFDLLDNADRPIGELHPARDDFTPVITHDTTRLVMRDMENVNLTPVEQAEVNPLSDRIRPVLILEDGSEHPLGVFIFTDATKPRFSYGQPLVGTLMDKGFILDHPIEHSVAVAESDPIRDVIIRLLNDAGVEAIVDGSAARTGAPLAWPAGTSMAQILVDLGLAAGYLPPFFDHHGVGHVQRVIDPETADPAVTYMEGRNIYARSPVESDDLLRAPNRFIVISNDASQQPVVGVYDVPAGAPFSFFNRGIRVVEVVDLQGVEDSAHASEAARAIALSRQVFEHVTLTGPPDPRHDGFTVIEYLGERWVEQIWSLPLSPVGPMTHTLRKVYM